MWSKMMDLAFSPSPSVCSAFVPFRLYIHLFLSFSSPSYHLHLAYTVNPTPPSASKRKSRPATSSPFQPSNTQDNSSPKMCTTNQLIYVCSHQATHRFRTGVCKKANRERCNIHDDTEILSFHCKNCAVQINRKRRRCGDGRNRSLLKQDALPNRLLNATWHVPSRCFVDVGFRTLDPFGAGDDQESAAEAGLRSQRAEISPFGTHVELVASRSPVETDQRGCWKFVGSQKCRPSPCCMAETRQGAYQATRLEGREERVRGRIMDSFCESSV